MNWLLDLVLLTLCLAFAGSYSRITASPWLQSVKEFGRPIVPLAVSGITLFGCFAIAALVHEPVPRLHDEFSYQLMGETLTAGHLFNQTPPLPEFFETFHVLLRPVHASKYFPGQGLFLAIGKKLTGHPSLGVWLSSALACAAVTWMLQAWIGPGWALFGAILMVAQYGVFSYWSQSYWGGMVATLGGALFLGAIRRLWDRITWQGALWLSLGLVLLANSRPLEGVIATLPAGGHLLYKVLRNRQWRTSTFWLALVLPSLAVLFPAASAMGTYNRAITGSAFKTPYALHEQQYQETPLLIFLPVHPKLTYSSPALQYYYEVNEMKPYVTQRVPKYFITAVVRKFTTWWAFYCGVLLTTPLVLPGLLRKGKIRWVQAALLASFVVLSIFSSPTAIVVRGLIDLLVVLQIVVLWLVFDDLWSRVAILTCSLIMFVLLFAKWFFPHYFAPAACLVLYLEVEGLRRIWNWNTQAEEKTETLTRAERRRSAREGRDRPPMNLRRFVYLLPAACLLSLVFRIEARLNSWRPNPFGGPDRLALLTQDWSLDRANMEKWLEQQPKPQLVFVRYSPYHNINFEWVYNHADIMHSRVIWARDLGVEHNKLLLNLLPDRSVWLLEADRRNPQLIPYADATPALTQPSTKEWRRPEEPE